MSDVESPPLDEPVVLSKEQELQERKRARSLVSEALLSAGVPLDARGLTKQLLPGLWYAAMSVIFNLLDREELIALLTSRHATIAGFADNASAPPKVMTSAAMQHYLKQVEKAASTILEKLDEAQNRMEEQEIEYWYPETVFDAVTTVLLPAWGPDHVRRAIEEQSSWLYQNKIEIRNFMEPSRLATIPKAVHAANAVDVVKASEPQQDIKVKRQGSNRTVSAYLSTTTFENNQTGWVVVMRIKFANGRHENREVFGTLGDPTGNKSRLHIVHEFVLALSQDEGHADVELKVSDSNLLRAMPFTEDSATEGKKFDKNTWAEIQSCFEKNSITCKLVDISLVDEMQQRSDIILRNLEG
jgi:hypothetical protein